MTSDSLATDLAKHLPKKLAKDIVSHFISMRLDAANGVLERSSPGKFVETFVQVLQFLDSGTHSTNFKVGDIDDFLKNAESRPLNFPDGLRLIATRVARGMYSLRSKRSIVHKGEVDPNIYDLRCLYQSAQWILSELIRHILSTDVHTAGALVEFVQIPLSATVEDFGDRRLVLASLPARDELLVLLHHYYPEWVAVSQIHRDMDRVARSTVSNALSSARRNRLVEGEPSGSYKLTGLGFQKAIDILRDKVNTAMSPA